MSGKFKMIWERRSPESAITDFDITELTFDGHKLPVHSVKFTVDSKSSLPKLYLELSPNDIEIVGPVDIEIKTVPKYGEARTRNEETS